MRSRTRGNLDSHEPPTTESGRLIANHPVVVLLTLLATVIGAITGVVVALQSNAHPATGAPPTIPQTTAAHSTEPLLPSTSESANEATYPTRTTSSPTVPPAPPAASPAAPFQITNVTWDSQRRTGPTTAEPGTAVSIRITVEPRSANVNVSCRDLSTGKRLLFDIGSMYTCYIPNYDATAGKHTVQVTVVEQETGYKQTRKVSFTLTV
jgi:hypothetical protein